MQCPKDDVTMVEATRDKREYFAGYWVDSKEYFHLCPRCKTVIQTENDMKLSSEDFSRMYNKKRQEIFDMVKI